MKVTADGIPVQEVIASVKLAIREAGVSAAAKDRDLRVQSVNLTLRVLAIRGAGGGLSFTVPFIGMPVRFGAKVTRSDTHEIVINLAAPAPEPGEEVRESLDQVLADSIETIRAVLATAAGGDDPFILTDAKITLSFAVTAEGTISIGIDETMSDEVTHSLVLALVPA